MLFSVFMPFCCTCKSPKQYQFNRKIMLYKTMQWRIPVHIDQKKSSDCLAMYTSFLGFIQLLGSRTKVSAKEWKNLNLQQNIF